MPEQPCSYQGSETIVMKLSVSLVEVSGVPGGNH